MAQDLVIQVKILMGGENVYNLSFLFWVIMQIVNSVQICHIVHDLERKDARTLESET